MSRLPCEVLPRVALAHANPRSSHRGCRVTRGRARERIVALSNRGGRQCLSTPTREQKPLRADWARRRGPPGNDILFGSGRHAPDAAEGQGGPTRQVPGTRDACRADERHGASRSTPATRAIWRQRRLWPTSRPSPSHALWQVFGQPGHWCLVAPLCQSSCLTTWELSQWAVYIRKLPFVSTWSWLAYGIYLLAIPSRPNCRFHSDPAFDARPRRFPIELAAAGYCGIQRAALTGRRRYPPHRWRVCLQGLPRLADREREG